jgi:hypothetical protein
MLLVPEDVDMMSDGCLHGEQRDNLQEMVLNDVSDRTDLFV